MKSLTKEQALNRLAAQCAAAEQAPADLLRKLTSWGLSEQDQAAIIRQLQDNQFVNAARYARAYTREKQLFQGWGRIKIRQGLRAKGIDTDTIDDAFSEMDEEEYREHLHQLLEHKLQSLPQEARFKTAQKLVRFGASRGFEPDLLFDMARHVMDEVANYED